MSATTNSWTLSWSSAAAAGNATVASAAGLQDYDWITLTATLQGATGGTLDVYVQRFNGVGWEDWIHFAQQAAAAAANTVAVQPLVGSAITAVGTGTTHALAASTCVGGHPGNQIRVREVTGAGTSAGAAQTIIVTGWRRRV